MSATSAPFGYRVAFHPSGVPVRQTEYTIASTYGTSIYRGAPCILNTNGTITVGAGAADLIGVFAGCTYVDSTGRPQQSSFWPASTTATNIKAYVWDDPDIVFEVQADGSIAQTAVGDQADLTNVGNNALGVSTSTLSATLSGATVQAQFRIVGFGKALDNTPGDAFTVVQVQIARHTKRSNKVAI